MHLNTTEEMHRACDILTPYVQYSHEKGVHLKPDVPDLIKKLWETNYELGTEMTKAYYDNDCMQSVGYTKEKGFEVCSDAPEKIKNLHRTLQELLEQIEGDAILSDHEA